MLRHVIRLRAVPRSLGLKGRVPAVLDGVVRAPRDELRDLRPLVPKLSVRPKQGLLLLFRPGVLADVRV